MNVVRKNGRARNVHSWQLFTFSDLTWRNALSSRFAEMSWIYSVKTMNTPQNFAQLKTAGSSLICREKTVILGDVTIGPECVIHPTTTIIAKSGPIVIGSGNLIEERVQIINNRPEPMIIGDNNAFEVDSRSEAQKIGDYNILEAKSSVGPNIQLTNRCIIGAGCTVSGDDSTILRPNTVITGLNSNRRVVQDIPASSHSSQLDFLRKILPNYQKLLRPLVNPNISSDLPATPPLKSKE